MFNSEISILCGIFAVDKLTITYTKFIFLHDPVTLGHQVHEQLPCFATSSGHCFLPCSGHCVTPRRIKPSSTAIFFSNNGEKRKKERKQHRPCLFLSIAPNGFSRHRTLKADLPSQTGFFLYRTPWISGNVQNRITLYNIFHVSVFFLFYYKNTWKSSDISSQGCIFFLCSLFCIIFKSTFKSTFKCSFWPNDQMTKPHSVTASIAIFQL